MKILKTFSKTSIENPLDSKTIIESKKIFLQTKNKKHTKYILDFVNCNLSSASYSSLSSILMIKSKYSYLESKIYFIHSVLNKKSGIANILNINKDFLQSKDKNKNLSSIYYIPKLTLSYDNNLDSKNLKIATIKRFVC